MLNVVVVAALIVSLSIIVALGFYTLFRIQSEKRNYFLLCMLSASAIVLGNLLEVISIDAGEAFTGLKILYLGGYLSTFTFLFVADYFDIKLPKYPVKAPLLIIPGIITIIFFTTNIHHLVYDSYWLSTSVPHYLDFNAGPLYTAFNFYPALCIFASSVMIVIKYRAAKKERRRPLIFLLIGVWTPLAATLVYVISVATGLNPQHIFLTPYFLAVMTVFFYIGIIRYGMLDIVGKATTLTMGTIAEAYLLVDDELRLLDANAAARNLFGDLAKLPKKAAVTSISGWPQELSASDTSDDHFSVDFSLGDDQARHYTAKISKIPTQGDTAAGWVFLIRDITENYILMKRLEEAAYTDALTSLYNRRYFMDLATINFEKAKRQGQICFAMILDLDFFKKVNDTYGHLAGDEVLRTMSVRARDALRPYDLLARYGGEEFVVLLTDSSKDVAELLSERLRQAVAASSCSYEGAQIPITVSIGVAQSLPQDTLGDILARADLALYEAKNNGRNQVAFARV